MCKKLEKRSLSVTYRIEICRRTFSPGSLYSFEINAEGSNLRSTYSLPDFFLLLSLGSSHVFFFFQAAPLLPPFVPLSPLFVFFTPRRVFQKAFSFFFFSQILSAQIPLYNIEIALSPPAFRRSFLPVLRTLRRRFCLPSYKDYELV